MSWSLHLKANAGDDQHVGRDVSAATDARICDTKDARVSQSMPLLGKGADSHKGMPFPRFCVNEPESEAFENRNYGERDFFFFFFVWHKVYSPICLEWTQPKDTGTDSPGLISFI